MSATNQLRADALAIWQAGVDAVRSEPLIEEYLRVEGHTLLAGDEEIPLDDVRRIVVIGAGKAGAGMAAAVEGVLGADLLAEKDVTGIVSLPANCVRPLHRVQLRSGRPAGVNEPTEEGVRAAEEMLTLVNGMSSDDLCLCLISGGGSALLPAPALGVTLADKQFLTRELAARGADICQLNVVRKQLSRIKGGGLARSCRAGSLVTLIISDVLGDPIDVIASGPTVEDRGTPGNALDVLTHFNLAKDPRSANAVHFLQERIQMDAPLESPTCRVTNLIIGNNATAIDAAGLEAVRRGYSPAMVSVNRPEGLAEEVAADLAGMAGRMREQRGPGRRDPDGPDPDCLISGGEPTVKLVEESKRGLGGRNQQLVLAAMLDLGDLHGITILSGGTDGEDGPTDAAGAVVDEHIAASAREQGLDARDFLARNDAYHFFEPLGALIKTGPTDTNVCDIRVIVVSRSQ